MLFFFTLQAAFTVRQKTPASGMQWKTWAKNSSCAECIMNAPSLKASQAYSRSSLAILLRRNSISSVSPHLIFCCKLYFFNRKLRKELSNTHTQAHNHIKIYASLLSLKLLLQQFTCNYLFQFQEKWENEFCIPVWLSLHAAKGKKVLLYNAWHAKKLQILHSTGTFSSQTLTQSEYQESHRTIVTVLTITSEVCWHY